MCNRNKRFMKEPSKNDHPGFWCGCHNHYRKYRPARDTICSNYNKKGHYQSVCLSKKPYPRKVHAVEEDEEDIHFLHEISSDKNYWSSQIGVNGRTTCFKLDTDIYMRCMIRSACYSAGEPLLN